MASKKTVFVAFAIDDAKYRDLLKGQSLHPDSTFEYIDMSVKKPYDSEWKERVRTRIKRSAGIIALVSPNSLTSTGQKWEIACAKEEGVKMIGLRCQESDTTTLSGVSLRKWTKANLEKFIDSL